MLLKHVISVMEILKPKQYKSDSGIHYSSHKTMAFPRLMVASLVLVMVQYSTSYDNSVYIRALRNTLSGCNGKGELIEDMDMLN